MPLPITILNGSFFISKRILIRIADQVIEHILIRSLFNIAARINKELALRRAKFNLNLKTCLNLYFNHLHHGALASNALKYSAMLIL